MSFFVFGVFGDNLITMSISRLVPFRNKERDFFVAFHVINLDHRDVGMVVHHLINVDVFNISV
jgi:hypothetical protein